MIAAEATNWPDPKHNKGTNVTGANPAGFIAWVGGFDDGKQTWGVGTDATWLWARGRPERLEDRAPTSNGWKHVAELPGAERIYGGQVNLAEVVGRGLADRRRHAPPSLARLRRPPDVLPRPDQPRAGRHPPRPDRHHPPGPRTDQRRDPRRPAHARGRSAGSTSKADDPEALARKLFQVALGRTPTPGRAGRRERTDRLARHCRRGSTT